MNIDAVTLASILLALRLIAATLLSAVLWRQIYNIRTKRTDYPAVRMSVFILTIVLLIGQLIPIVLDAVVIFGESYPGRNSTPNVLSSSYALNNALKDVVIGSLLAFLFFRTGKGTPK